jgi:hypothetical protein
MGTHYTIAYGEEDILIAGGMVIGAGIKATGWVVDVDTASTDDPADDTIMVSGGDQTELAEVGHDADTELTEVGVGGAKFLPGCRINPSTGIAGVQRASNRGGGWLLFTFHDQCDGKADVTAAMAPYELMLGKAVDLDFLQQ